MLSHVAYLLLVLLVFGLFSAMIAWADLSTRHLRPPVPAPRAEASPAPR